METAQKILGTFAINGGFQHTELAPAFGTQVDETKLRELADDSIEGYFGDICPMLKLSARSLLSGARGVYKERALGAATRVVATLRDLSNYCVRCQDYVGEPLYHKQRAGAWGCNPSCSNIA